MRTQPSSEHSRVCVSDCLRAFIASGLPHSQNHFHVSGAAAAVQQFPASNANGYAHFFSEPNPSEFVDDKFATRYANSMPRLRS